MAVTQNIHVHIEVALYHSNAFHVAGHTDFHENQADILRTDHDALARAVFKAAVHHNRSSIITPAGAASSANPASTSPPW
jgi:hypothetical protein